MGHMNPDLMGSAGFQIAANPAVMSKSLNQLVTSDGRLTALAQHCHPRALRGMSANIGLYPAGIIGLAPYDGRIFSVHRARL